MNIEANTFLRVNLYSFNHFRVSMGSLVILKNKTDPWLYRADIHDPCRRKKPSWSEPAAKAFLNCELAASLRAEATISFQKHSRRRDVVETSARPQRPYLPRGSSTSSQVAQWLHWMQADLLILPTKPITWIQFQLNWGWGQSIKMGSLIYSILLELSVTSSVQFH